MLTNSYVSRNTPSPSGYHITLVYEFDSNQTSKLHLTSPNEEDAAALLVSRQDSVVENLENSNAIEAFENNITTAYKEASQALVQYQYLKAGLLEEEPYKAYELMGMVADDILGLGLTVEQMADALNSTVEEAQMVLDKWYYLDANKTTINAYKGLL